MFEFDGLIKDKEGKFLTAYLINPQKDKGFAELSILVKPY